MFASSLWLWLVCGIAHAQDAPAPAPDVSTEGPTEPVARRDRPIPAWRDDGWHLDTLVGTAFPLDVGGRIQLETPHRVRVGLEVGFMPGPYQDAIQGILVSTGTYDAEQAEIVADSLSSSFTTGIGIGWRPLVREGFHFDAGYRYVSLGGESTREDLLFSAAGINRPIDLPSSEEREWDVRSSLHMVSVNLGWEFVPIEHFTIRIRLGGAFTVAASSRITPAFDARAIDEEVLRAVANPSEEWLRENLERYGHIPSIGLDIGYRWM